jgi:hypothetical protein
MKTGKLVKLTKLRQSGSPAVSAGNWNTYVPGSAHNATSLPVDYEMIGVLLEPPAVGGRVKLLRLERNGVKSMGLFESTQITSVNGSEFTTQNSIYRLEEYAPPSTATD